MGWPFSTQFWDVKTYIFWVVFLHRQREEKMRSCRDLEVAHWFNLESKRLEANKQIGNNYGSNVCLIFSVKTLSELGGQEYGRNARKTRATSKSMREKGRAESLKSIVYLSERPNGNDLVPVLIDVWNDSKRNKSFVKEYSHCQWTSHAFPILYLQRVCVDTQVVNSYTLSTHIQQNDFSTDVSEMSSCWRSWKRRYRRGFIERDNIIAVDARSRQTTR